MLATHRYYVVGLAAFLSIFSCSIFLLRQHRNNTPYHVTVGSSISPTTTTTAAAPPVKLDFRNTIATLFDAIKLDVQSPGYRDPSGKKYDGGDKVWTQPLKDKILIVDIDTRVPTGENQVLNPDMIDWEHLDMGGEGLVSNAIMNHYLYAQIHGYDYKFYSARHIPGHHDTWILPHVFHELVPTHQFVVAMDADVTISHLEVPLEWMFNRWGIQNTTSMAMPWDTEEFRGDTSISTDSKGLCVLNTGLVVAQNSPTTMEMLAAWKDCTTETRYKGCGKWKEEWSHEQRAFSEYIRYDFNQTAETVVSIPCDDAMGWPGFMEEVQGKDRVSDCNGNFIRHHTLRKSRVKESASTSVMQAISALLQHSIQAQKSTLWYQEPKKKILSWFK